jgi:hypothetical protein
MVSIKPFITPKAFAISFTVLVCLLLYIKTFEDKIRFTIRNAFSSADGKVQLKPGVDMQNPSKDEFIYRRHTIDIPDEIFPPRSEDYIVQQVAFMGVTGREWYMFYNLLDFFAVSHLAAFVLVAAYQLVVDKYEELYLRGRTNKNSPGWIEGLKDFGYSVVVAQWCADLIENICVRTHLNVYPERYELLLRSLLVATSLKWMSILLLLSGIALFSLGSVIECFKGNARLRSLQKKVE